MRNTVGVPLPAELLILKGKTPNADRAIFVADGQAQTIRCPGCTLDRQGIISNKRPGPATRSNKPTILTASLRIDHAHTAVVADDRELRPVRRTIQFEGFDWIPEGPQMMRKGLAQWEASGSCITVHAHLSPFSSVEIHLPGVQSQLIDDIRSRHDVASGKKLKQRASIL